MIYAEEVETNQLIGLYTYSYLATAGISEGFFPRYGG